MSVHAGGLAVQKPLDGARAEPDERIQRTHARLLLRRRGDHGVETHRVQGSRGAVTEGVVELVQRQDGDAAFGAAGEEDAELGEGDGQAHAVDVVEVVLPADGDVLVEGVVEGDEGVRAVDVGHVGRLEHVEGGGSRKDNRAVGEGQRRG